MGWGTMGYYGAALAACSAAASVLQYVTLISAACAKVKETLIIVSSTKTTFRSGLCTANISQCFFSKQSVGYHCQYPCDSDLLSRAK